MVLVSAIAYAPLARAANGAPDPTRDFITTCTYGALAGGLVGAATLAFSDDPGNKISNVARGASLGLYAGIALGLYMMNGGPSGSDDDAAAAAAAGITFNERTERGVSDPVVLLDAGDFSSEKNSVVSRKPTSQNSRAELKREIHQASAVGFAILPMVSERGVEGASAQLILGAF